jgi:VWFA-related protein
LSPQTTRSSLLLLWLLAAPAAAAGQEVVFRSSVDLVTVDAVVLDGNGRPLPNLRAEDFVVEVDGRRRPVVSAQFIAPQARPGTPAPLDASHFTTNEDADAGRFIVIAIDEAHIRRLEGRPALQAAARFIDSLDPADRVAVTGLSRIGLIEFTRDRNLLKKRLESLVGQTDPVFLQFNLGLLEAVEVADGNRNRLADVVLRECGRALSEYTSTARAADDSAGRDACPEQVEQEARAVAQHARTQARISLSALGALIETLKTLEGPKTVVLLSEGMTVDARLVDLGQLAAATRDARVAIYGLHMETPLFEASQDRISPTFLQDVQIKGDGLARLAGAARGAMFRLVGSDTRAFARIAQEISAYYLLAIEPTEADRDGNVHRIDVQLAGRGGLVRARSAFRMPTVVPSPRVREEDLVALLRTSRPAAELPVRVATFVYAEPASQDLRVVVSTETEPALGAGDVLLGYVLVDGRGIVVASGAHRVADGHRAFSTKVAPGSYTLRVGGIDPLGRRGIVQRTFRAFVPVQNGVRMSDVMVAPVPPEAQTPLDPIVDRTAENRVNSFVEVYAGGAEPLPDLQLVFEITAPGASAALATQEGRVERHGTRWLDARAEFALDTLPAGAYVAVARVMAGDRELARALRPFTWAGK